MTALYFPIVLWGMMAGGIQASGETPIQDNSFLVEEAYNQEPGVVQHIGTFQRNRQTGDWTYAFTQEWPAPRQAHQISYTVPVQRVRSASGDGAGVGDLALNYRYQIVGSGRTRVAVAPRVSLLLPAGDASRARGTGGIGYQANLPVSLALSDRFVAHSNAGLTLTLHQRNSAGERASTAAWNVGQSLVWLARPYVNGLLEIVYARGEIVTGPGRTASTRACYVSPGIRWAMNLRGGLQVVPGAAVPIGVGPSSGERLLFFYLSFEHPLWRTK